MSPQKTPRHRIRRGKTALGFHADCVTCGHFGTPLASRDLATIQFQEHRRTGKVLR